LAFEPTASGEAIAGARWKKDDAPANGGAPIAAFAAEEVLDRYE